MDVAILTRTHGSNLPDAVYFLLPISMPRPASPRLPAEWRSFHPQFQDHRVLESNPTFRIILGLENAPAVEEGLSQPSNRSILTQGL